jgi:hypothetical protein
MDKHFFVMFNKTTQQEKQWHHSEGEDEECDTRTSAKKNKKGNTEVACPESRD